jgi:hypothetical protein
MTAPHEKTFAADARGLAAGQRAKDVPAWKKEAFNPATTFGKITSMSIAEQRKSLPIYKFRDQLIEAFANVSPRPFFVPWSPCETIARVSLHDSHPFAMGCNLLLCPHRTKSSSLSATPGRARRRR